MGGFQLWANLPAAQKMMDPRYRDVKAEEIPVVSLKTGVEVRVICGDVAGRGARCRTSSSTRSTWMSPCRRDSESIHTVKRGHTAFAYVFEGSGRFDDEKGKSAASGSLVLFSDGDQVAVTTRERAGPVSAGFGKTHRRAGRLARAHRDEHASGTEGRLRGIQQRDLHQTQITVATTTGYISCRS